MRENMGSTEQKIRLGIGSAAAAVAIYVPLRYKWKGILSAVAASELFSGATGFSPMKKVLGLGRR